MAIVFGHFGSANVKEVDYAARNAECLAKGETVRPITAAELDAMSEHMDYDVEGVTVTHTIWPKSIQGRLVELKPGAYTAAEVEAIKNGSTVLLSEGYYGKKWRIWMGWPTEEQKAATPWEGDENAG